MAEPDVSLPSLSESALDFVRESKCSKEFVWISARKRGSELDEVGRSRPERVQGVTGVTCDVLAWRAKAPLASAPIFRAMSVNFNINASGSDVTMWLVVLVAGVRSVVAEVLGRSEQRALDFESPEGCQNSDPSLMLDRRRCVCVLGARGRSAVASVRRRLGSLPCLF